MKTKILTAAILFSFSLILNGQIIHVPGDQPTIQEGISTANNGDTILVDQGTYYENINFLGKSITVASKFLMDGDTNQQQLNKKIVEGC